ncbi:hypothetical protein [Methanosarcina sp.]|jgi:hypothetical protein|uniref:hypothetical protein n=1 Tax=Methanosarcina sp. TaxID=2213 RepID=UPI002C76ECFB|nr:hypothetical protein [Methanosarcina sp.]HOW13399.1 hypothetical protein [Methanosarcina sp.]
MDKNSNADNKLITENRKSYRKAPDARRSPESSLSFTASPNTAALKNVPIKHISEQEQGTPGNSFTIR